MPETLTVTGGIIALLVNALVMGIREWKKAKTWKKNGTALKEIKETVDKTDKKIVKIDKSMGIVQTDVKNMRANCKTTVERFTKEISENRSQIFDIAKSKRK